MNSLEGPQKLSEDEDGTVHKISRNMSEAKRNFDEYARAQVSIDSKETHAIFHSEHFPSNEIPTSAAFALERVKTEGEDPELGVVGLHISVNKDFYGEEYADLIPYAVDHEVYEAWLLAKRGLRPKPLHSHLLARMRQIENAIKDGKGERLVNFYIEKVPSLKQELEEAYTRAKRKQNIA